MGINKFFRTAPTRRLLTVVGGTIAVVIAGTAIAIAAQGRGPVPKRESLATALHQALNAHQVTAVSARISFANNLIGSGQIQGSDPLLSGASGRLWYSSTQGLRLELQGDNGDTNLVVRNGSFWAYDPSSNIAYEGKLPTGSEPAAKKTDKPHALPTVAEIQRELSRAMAHLGISGAIPGDVAGRPVYTVRVSPRQNGSLLGGVQVAWDALRGVPLRFAVYARGDSTPVLSLSATNISYGKVSGSVFSISPPSGAKVVTVSLPTGKMETATKKHAALPALPFTATEPATLAGLPRTSVTRLGKDGVLILYGRYLGGVVVIEQVAHSGATQLAPPTSGDQPGFNLPSVSINGTSGQEIDTALGTVVRFATGGVQYTVLGSVSKQVADAAARGL